MTISLSKRGAAAPSRGAGHSGNPKAAKMGGKSSPMRDILHDMVDVILKRAAGTLAPDGPSAAPSKGQAPAAPGGPSAAPSKGRAPAAPGGPSAAPSKGQAPAAQGGASPPEAVLAALQKNPITSALIKSLAGTPEGAQALELLIGTPGGQKALATFMSALPQSTPTKSGGNAPAQPSGNTPAQPSKGGAQPSKGGATPEQLLGAIQKTPQGAALLKGFAATPGGQQMLKAMLSAPEGQQALIALVQSLSAGGGNAPSAPTKGGGNAPSAPTKSAGPTAGAAPTKGASPASGAAGQAQSFLANLAKDPIGGQLLQLLSKTPEGGQLLQALATDPRGQKALQGLLRGLSTPSKQQQPRDSKSVVDAVKKSPLGKAFVAVLQNSGQQGTQLVNQLMTTPQGQQGLMSFLQAAQDLDRGNRPTKS